MTHARIHEKPVGIVNSGLAAKCLYYARVILRAVARRDLRIAPAVILNQLSAVTDEPLQIRIKRVDRASIGSFRSRDIALTVELRNLPGRIPKDEEANVVRPRGSSRPRPAEVGPSELAASRQACGGSGSRGVRHGRINGVHGLHLPGDQTLFIVRATAFQ